MKKRSKKWNTYFPGALYSIAFCLPVIVLLVFLLSKFYTIEGRGDPIGIVIAAVFIVLFMLLLKAGRKLFDVTEKAYLKCGDAQKAYGKAVLTEAIVFFVFLILLMFLITAIF